ncbi:vgr related protein [Sphingomonas humi]|uniref:Vgr related protein n=1 Tax=Sphingomonas humi TaxID=335630 RepID=A0ABP7S259_9SPHN
MAAHRPLTSGEVAMAQSVFGATLDYARVRLVRGKWWPFQPCGTAMAPCGHIHFHPDDPNWRDDFSTAEWALQGLFIHELTHVWQTQRAGRFYLPLMRHPFCRYRYTYQPGRPFLRYGLEQQAELVRHAFLQRRGIRPVRSADLAAIEGILPFSAPVRPVA